ncbi:MAG: transcription initiation factor IIB family protein [Halolamina sp.]
MGGVIMGNPAESVTQKSDEQENSQRDVETGQCCPECGGKPVSAEDRGEVTCAECGLVLNQDTIDRGPEWRSFESEENQQRSRVGAPASKLLHDEGLRTNIGWNDKDGYGKELSAKKRRRIQRLRTWDERFRTKNSQERNLRQALGEIQRMASALGLAESVQKTASILYRRAVSKDLLRGRSIEGMSTASLYAAARQHGTPRTLGAFAGVSRVEKVRFQRTYRYLNRELSLEVEPEDPIEYLPQFASSLDLSTESERLAEELLKTAKQRGAHSGKSPAGLAGAALYAASHLANEQLTQQTVADAESVSKVTIRDRYQELLEIYADSGPSG